MLGDDVVMSVDGVVVHELLLSGDGVSSHHTGTLEKQNQYEKKKKSSGRKSFREGSPSGPGGGGGARGGSGRAGGHVWPVQLSSMVEI